MPKELIVSEKINLAALMDKGQAIEFFVKNDQFAVGDIYLARVENILPSIDAVFVNLGSTSKMGFLHASDIEGAGPLKRRIFPRQRLLVQVEKQPTGNKGPRVTTNITLTGRFLVLTTAHEQIIVSRRINNPDQKARLKAIATLLKPPVGFGLIIRTEAENATEEELEEDFKELFLQKWKFIIDQFEIQNRPGLLVRDSKDLLHKVLRDVFHYGVQSIVVDNDEFRERAEEYLRDWSFQKPPKVELYKSSDEMLEKFGVTAELRRSLYPRVDLASGGYLLIQPTEAMTVIDVNSGKFTSSHSPAETVFLTNLEAATEVARQLRLRNIGGVIVIDFIDMENKYDRLLLLENFSRALENDPSKPQIGRLSDLGLVEVTRPRTAQSLQEALGHECEACSATGLRFPMLEQVNKASQQQQDDPPVSQQQRTSHQKQENKDLPIAEQDKLPAENNTSLLTFKISSAETSIDKASAESMTANIINDQQAKISIENIEDIPSSETKVHTQELLPGIYKLATDNE